MPKHTQGRPLRLQVGREPFAHPTLLDLSSLTTEAILRIFRLFLRMQSLKTIKLLQNRTLVVLSLLRGHLSLLPRQSSRLNSRQRRLTLRVHPLPTSPFRRSATHSSIFVQSRIFVPVPTHLTRFSVFVPLLLMQFINSSRIEDLFTFTHPLSQVVTARARVRCSR